MAIEKPTGELTQKDLEKEFWRLDFRFAPISDEGLKEISKIKQVKEVLFNQTAVITDAGLKEVAKTKNIESLHLVKTKVTSEGVAQLQKELPDCEIRHHAKEPTYDN